LIEFEGGMTIQFRSRQRGLSFLGLLVVGGMLAACGVIIVEIVPTAIEYQGVRRAADKAQEGTSMADVRSIFDRAASVDNIKSISGKDLEVSKEGEKIVVSFAYQREIHLFGPAYLTLKYSGRSK
jgi:hypothetical protein